MAFSISGVPAAKTTNYAALFTATNKLPKPGTYDYSGALNGKNYIDDGLGNGIKSGYLFTPGSTGTSTDDGIFGFEATAVPIREIMEPSAPPAAPNGNTPVDGSSSGETRPRRRIDFYA